MKVCARPGIEPRTSDLPTAPRSPTDMTDLFGDDRVHCARQNKTGYPYFFIFVHYNAFQSSKFNQVISDTAQLPLFPFEYGKNDNIDILIIYSLGLQELYPFKHKKLGHFSTEPWTHWS